MVARSAMFHFPTHHSTQARNPSNKKVGFRPLPLLVPRT
jgi:hypothetical protein